MPVSTAKRQADLADRQRAAGRTQRKVWAHPDDWPKIMAYVQLLNLSRSSRTEIARNNNRPSEAPGA